MGADEFIVNDDENGNGAPPAEDANNRTFLILASVMTGTLLLLSLFTIGYLLTNQSGDRSGEVAVIETQNSVILATNAAVTQTIESLELAAQATEDAIAVEQGATPLPDEAAAGEATEAEATNAVEATSNAALLGSVSPEDATATAEVIAADPTLSANATGAAATIAADPTLAAAVTAPALLGGVSPEDATATAEVIAADPTLSANATGAAATIAADPTLAAAVTEAAGGATPAPPAEATATDEAGPTAETAATATVGGQPTATSDASASATADLAATTAPAVTTAPDATGGETTSSAVTTTGSDVTVTAGSAAITFASVTGEGLTTVEPLASAPALPAGYLPEGALFYDISTTATYGAPVAVCLDYPPGSLDEPVRLLHFSGGEWIDLTTTSDPDGGQVCGEADSLSPFAVVTGTAPDGGPTVTAIPPSTSAPGETPDATVVIIGVTMEPTAEGGSATPDTLGGTAAAATGSATPEAAGSGTPSAAQSATPTTSSGGDEEAGGGAPGTPAATAVLEGYPVATPGLGTPGAGYPAAVTPSPAATGGGGTGQQSTPEGGVTETPVGGATPSQPGTPTVTSLPPTATQSPTATLDPTATTTALPTATGTVVATATATATGTTLPTATGTILPTATGTVILPTPTVTPTPPTTLPQTGLNAWSVAVVGLILVLIVFGARRLRRA